MFHRVKKKLVLFRLRDHPSKQKPVSQKRNPKKSPPGESCPNGCSLSQSLRCLLFQGGDTNQCWRWALFTINNPLLSQHTLIAIIIIAPNGIGSMMIVVIFALLSAINRECGGKVNRGSAGNTRLALVKYRGDQPGSKSAMALEYCNCRRMQRESTSTLNTKQGAIYLYYSCTHEHTIKKGQESKY